MSAAAHGSEQRPELERRVSYTRCPALPNASTLAHQLGLITAAFADDDGIGIEEKIGSDAHAAGYRYWLRHAGYSKPLWARSNGADTHVIAISKHESACPIYCLSDSGIASAGDLRGRRLGLVRDGRLALDYNRAIYLQSYLAGLARAGLDLRDVELIDFEIDREGLMTRAGAHYADLALSTMRSPAGINLFTEIAKESLLLLLRGKVDAVASNVPPALVEFFGLRKVYDSRDDPDIHARHDLRCLVASGPLVRERRDVLVRVLERLLAAGEWAHDNPAQAIGLLAADLRITEEVLLMDCDDIVGGMQIDASSDAIEMLRAKKDLLVRHGYVGRDVALEQWVDGSILEDARRRRARSRTAGSAAGTGSN